MICNIEQTALLLTDSTMRTKLYIALEENSINGIFPSKGKNYLDLLNSKEYKFDYVIISYDHIDFSDAVSLIQSKEDIILIVAYDKNKQDEDTISLIQNSYKYYLEKGSVLKEFSKLIIKIRENAVLSSNSNEKYTFLKNIGTGANASVDLYKDNENNILIAVKKISLEGETDAGINKIKEEFDKMQMVKSPTVIESYHSVSENNQMYIYLEYAEGGSLDDKIRENKILGNKFSFDNLCNYIIEILIGLYAMNINNLIHRDVKSENILITKDNIAKLSDLGISRVVGDSYGSKFYTVCGTPFYISPEIVSELPYDFTVDIWSLGVVLYEMVTGEKPFNSDSELDLYNAIKTSDYPNLPQDTDIRIIYLIDVMLRKSPSRRFTVKQLLSLDFMYDKFVNLANSNGWIEKYEYILDLVKSLKKIPFFSNIISDINNTSDIEICSHAYRIYFNTPNTSYKKSLFSKKITNSKNGEDIYNSFLEDDQLVEIYKTPEFFYTKLIDLSILIPININNDELFIKESLFIFSFDNEEINNPILYFKNSEIEKDINKLTINDNTLPEHYNLVTVTQSILFDGKAILNHIIKDDDQTDKLKLINQDFHVNFFIGISYFNYFNITELEEEEKIVSLLNIYQIMYIHNRVKKYLAGVHTEHTSNIITYSFYDYTLNNLEIKHIIFRANKKPPNYYLRMVYNSDPKANILPNYSDLRPLLILYDFEYEDNVRTQVYEIKELDSQLEETCITFISNFVNYDGEKIELPLFIKPYISDYASDIEFIKFIAKHYNINKNKPTIFKTYIDESSYEIFDKMSLLMKNIQTNTIKIMFK